MSRRVLLHAPTAAALDRARANLRNLRRADPAAEVRILANAEGASAALSRPDADTDRHLVLCQNSLASRGLAAPAGTATVPAVVLALAELQEQGWIYVRA